MSALRGLGITGLGLRPGLASAADEAPCCVPLPPWSDAAREQFADVSGPGCAMLSFTADPQGLADALSVEASEPAGRFEPPVTLAP